MVLPFLRIPIDICINHALKMHEMLVKSKTISLCMNDKMKCLDGEMEGSDSVGLS